jgi:3-deoxy-D-manno-octulosonic-acid transferase
MQDETDAAHVVSLGMGSEKVSVTGNVKFDQSEELRDTELTEYFRTRFLLDGHVPLVVAASTHDPEENWIIDALETTGLPFRLVIAPRHPERFEQVLQDEIVPTDRAYSRRSDPISPSDKDAEIILLDSIGELRAIYPLADVVFVGGSLIPHGGQSILEPAAAGAAIITGPFTHNFSAAVATFRSRNALIQLSPDEDDLFSKFYKELADLLANAKRREEVGKNARAAFRESRGATERTIAHIQELLSENSEN